MKNIKKTAPLGGLFLYRENEMPRNGSNIYSAPAGTTATPSTKIESAKYNALVSDLVADANLPRPIVAGGTGGASATAARTNLGATATGTALFTAADAAAARTAIAAQVSDATLTSLAALGTAADKLAYTTGVDTWAEASLTAAGRALIDDADAAAQLVTLGVAGQTDAAWIAGASAIKGIVGPDQIKLAIAAQAVQLGGRSARVTPGAVASYDFTGIPAGVNTLTVALDQVSGTTTAYTYVQLGAGGVVETTGYVCTAAQNSGGATTSATSTTSNFHAMDNNSATTRVTGVMQFVRSGATDTWVGSGSISDTQVVRGGSFGGVKTLAGTLDRIRIGVESGNFDGGSFSVSWGY